MDVGTLLLDLELLVYNRYKTKTILQVKYKTNYKIGNTNYNGNLAPLLLGLVRGYCIVWSSVPSHTRVGYERSSSGSEKLLKCDSRV